MNISKFLLIDATLILAAIPLLFLLKVNKIKSNLLRSSNKEEFPRDVSIELPIKEELIELEKLAENQGSGIEFDSLLGDWKFFSVWKKNKDEEDTIISSLLRFFTAKIEFKEVLSNKKSRRLSVIASIQFGPITLKFSGKGYLKGKQPLLPFIMNLIELKSGSNIFFSRSISEREEEEKSFFALISLEENGHWLSARGQGGQVVIWIKD